MDSQDVLDSVLFMQIPGCNILLQALRVSRNDLVEIVRANLAEGETLDSMDAKRKAVIKLLEIAMEFDNQEKFLRAAQGINWWDSSSQLFSKGTMTPLEATRQGLLDEVLDKLRDMASRR